MCPIYEYQCEKCESIQDVRHKIDEVVEVLCCDKKCRKIISATGLVFVGRGFYENDYKARDKEG